VTFVPCSKIESSPIDTRVSFPRSGDCHLRSKVGSGDAQDHVFPAVEVVAFVVEAYRRRRRACKIGGSGNDFASGSASLVLKDVALLT